MWEHTRCRQQKSAQKYIKSGTVNVPWVFATSLNPWRLGGDDIPNSWQMTDTSSVAIPPAVGQAKAELLYSTRFQEVAEVQKAEDQAGQHGHLETVRLCHCAMAIGEARLDVTHHISIHQYTQILNHLEPKK